MCCESADSTFYLIMHLKVADLVLVVDNRASCRKTPAVRDFTRLLLQDLQVRALLQQRRAGLSLEFRPASWTTRVHGPCASTC